MPVHLKHDGIDQEPFARILDDFPILDLTSVAASSLDRCTPGIVDTVGDSISFQTASLPSFDALTLNFRRLDGGTGAATFLFADGSFDAIGSYTSIDGGATLTFSPVREAASWWMLIVGFGIAGMVLRRRRNRLGGALSSIRLRDPLRREGRQAANNPRRLRPRIVPAMPKSTMSISQLAASGTAESSASSGHRPKRGCRPRRNCRRRTRN